MLKLVTDGDLKDLEFRAEHSRRLCGPTSSILVNAATVFEISRELLELREEVVHLRREIDDLDD